MEEHSELCDCVVLYLNTGKRVLNDCLNFRKKLEQHFYILSFSPANGWFATLQDCFAA